MNRTEHFLECLSEECAEVAQRVSKALRFGLTEVQAGQPLNNAERICEELGDLYAVACILEAEGVLPGFMPTQRQIVDKQAKIERFMAISREQGVLHP